MKRLLFSFQLEFGSFPQLLVLLCCSSPTRERRGGIFSDFLPTQARSKLLDAFLHLKLDPPLHNTLRKTLLVQ